MRTDRELGRRLIEKALSMGADMAEVYERASKSITAESKHLRTDALEASEGFGYGIRVICNGRLGFAYSTEPERAMDVAASAVEAARFTVEDPALALPEPETYLDLQAFDPLIENITEEEAMAHAISVEASARGLDSRIAKVRKAAASFGASETLIMNSLGIDRLFQSTYCSASIMVVAEDAGEGQTGFSFSSCRFLRQVDFKAVGLEAGQKALMLLGARRTSPIKCPVVLDSYIAAQFLSVFSSMLSSEDVRKGRSLLKGRIGQRVASPIVDIVDDALMPEAPNLRNMDDEGVPARRNVFVREGLLEGYMYNTHSASKDGVKTTGNAVRGGYAGLPGIGPLSVHIAGRGELFSKEHLIEAAGCGLYVTSAMGIHTINPVSGEYSIGVSGLMIESGKPTYPVKEAVLSGNVLELFKGLHAVGSDLRFYGSIGAPSLLTAPLDLSA